MTEFLSNRSQQVMVDGCRSKLVNVVSGVPQGSVLVHEFRTILKKYFHLFSFRAISEQLELLNSNSSRMESFFNPINDTSLLMD